MGELTFCKGDGYKLENNNIVTEQNFLEECFQLTMTEEDFYFYPDSCVNLSQNDNGPQFHLL